MRVQAGLTVWAAKLITAPHDSPQPPPGQLQKVKRTFLEGPRLFQSRAHVLRPTSLCFQFTLSLRIRARSFIFSRCFFCRSASVLLSSLSGRSRAEFILLGQETDLARIIDESLDLGRSIPIRRRQRNGLTVEL